MAKPEDQVPTPNTGDAYASNTQSTLSPSDYLSYIYSTYSHQCLNISDNTPAMNIDSAMLVGKNTQSLPSTESPPVAVFGKRYKPVDKKVRPILGAVPSKFRIVRNIIGDPLADIPSLNPRPPPFTPTGRYTQERKEALEAAHSDGFLTEEEMKLLHHFMVQQNEGFAWTDKE